jgi:hypothetical protein
MLKLFGLIPAAHFASCAIALSLQGDRNFEAIVVVLHALANAVARLNASCAGLGFEP